MKSFREFILEAAARRAPRNPGESLQDYVKRVKGIDHPDLSPDENVRKSGKNTNVSSKDAGLGGQTKTQQSSTQSSSRQPSGGTGARSASSSNAGSQQTQSSSRQPSGGSGGRGTPPPPPSSSTTTPSSGRRPNQYRGPGTGRTERVKDLKNPGKGPGAFQTVKNNARNIKNFKPSRVPGLKGGGVLSGAIDTAVEKSRGSGWLRSLAKGTVSALGAVGGGIAGGAAGSLAGPVGTAVGGYTGQAAGAAAAGKAFDTVAGANAVERKAMATANRQRQAGGGLAGIGGKTTFSKGKGGTGFMSTGSGSQRKTVQLAKTSVVKDPKTGKAETGHLAFKGGQAVYKRAADPSTLAQTSSNPLERVGRSLFAGAYKAHDEKARQAKLKQAAQSDIKRQQALGVKGSKNLVGPKIVGPKIVGPKPVTKPKK